MKTGPFAEHSNQLWNISAVPSWSKVNQGLIRMYKAEVSGGWLVLLVLGPLIPPPPILSQRLWPSRPQSLSGERADREALC